jgi:hypothetical protein
MKNINHQIEEIIEARVKQNEEVFTPDSLVQQMLDKLTEVQWDATKTFADPACGNGNFLVAILQRKINNKHDPIAALSSIYGCDIMHDNIIECRYRLLCIVDEVSRINSKHVDIVRQNIVWLDTNVLPKGSLDYDFSFTKPDNNGKETELYLDAVKNKKLDIRKFAIQTVQIKPDGGWIDF